MRSGKVSSFSAILAMAVLLVPFNVHLLISAEEVPNQDHLVVASIGEPYTADPAMSYDSKSGELIFNVYETLISYEGKSVENFVPQLATDWWISEDGLTYVFKIRSGVKFHNNETLSTEDVEYSFERLMVRDFSSGPQWTAYEALLNVWGADLSDPNFGAKIDDAVESNATHVWFNLARPYAPFLSILCQPWSSIVNRKFSVEHGDWPQTWNNWTLYHDPEVSPLDNPEPVTCGTGPFKLDYWIKEDRYSLVKFENYWAGWPAKKPSETTRGNLERVTVQMVTGWHEKLDGFLKGTIDIIQVPTSHISEVEGQPGVRCIENLPTLSVTAMFFTFNIALTDLLGWPNPYIGEPPHEPGVIHETGIPVDFFSDAYVRKAFAHSFNYSAVIEDPYRVRGEAIRPATPVLVGLPYYNPLQEKYELNLTKAREYFQKAWGGQVWQEGFTFTIAYAASSLPPVGDWPDVLKANVEGLNPKFHVNIAAIAWSPYLSYVHAGVSPLFILGWVADYPDPHNLVEPFMYSEGTFAYWQRYNSTAVNVLVEEGLTELNHTRRQEAYHELQRLYYEDCPSVVVMQSLGRHWERDWVQGWYYNPSYPGLYFYVLWKRSVLSCDLNNDGVVDIIDVTIVALAFGSYPGHARWNLAADIDKNDKVNILDIAVVARDFGKTVQNQPAV